MKYPLYLLVNNGVFLLSALFLTKKVAGLTVAYCNIVLSRGFIIYAISSVQKVLSRGILFLEIKGNRKKNLSPVSPEDIYHGLV